jgi:hypothetical protein
MIPPPLTDQLYNITFIRILQEVSEKNMGRARPHARTKTSFSFRHNLEIKKVPKETFLILTFSDAHVIGKLMPAALWSRSCFAHRGSSGHRGCRPLHTAVKKRTKPIFGISCYLNGISGKNT